MKMTRMFNLRTIAISMALILSSTLAFGADTGGTSPVKFTYYGFRTGMKAFPWKDSAAMRKVTELTGVTLDMSYMPTADVDQKASLMIAAGDELADLIEPTLAQQKFIDSGSVIPLDDLINKYAPNIKKLWGSSLQKLRSPKDGKIYFIGNYPGNKNGEIADANQSLLIQYDVLEKLGYPTPKTLSDVETMLKKYLALQKDLNGKPFIPFGFWADTWGYNITVNNPAQWASGNLDDSDVLIDPKTYKLSYFTTSEQFKTYLKWMNRMQRQGLLYGDGFITKNDQYKALVSSGRVLAMIDGTWNIADPEAALRKAGMPERCYARFPIVNDVSIQDRSQIQSESYSWGVSISKNCKDPVRLIKFLDWCASDEGAKVLNWGVEGTHYSVVDGKRVQNPEVVKQWKQDPEYKYREQIGLFGFGQLGGAGSFQAVKLSDGDYATPWVNPTEAYGSADEWTKKVMGKYNVKSWGQMFDMTGKPNPYGFGWTITNLLPQAGKGNVALKKADDYRHNFVPVIVFSKSDREFDTNWATFVKKLKDDIKISVFEEEAQKALNDRLKLWGIQ